ncbi:MAG: MraY family glycosyltransferase, partial [Candidatus Omnitrophica bacterium]|nr:MraY family glycosyltransferase [Candidatus Omnitrophota bacterium]
MLYLLIIIVSFMVVYLSIPNIRYVALRFFVIDKKNDRKIHNKLITKMGGLGIYLGFIAGLAIITIFDLGILKINIQEISGIIICATLMLLLGIYDDLNGSNAVTKLTVQIIIALLFIKMGFKIERIYIANFIDLRLGIFSIPVTVLWISGITNAINLIDGLDGLAAGIVAINSLFFCLFGIIIKNNFIIFTSLSLLGANLAFLYYNFYPAKIFMGDTGSLFLGFIIACMAIYKTEVINNNSLLVPSILILFLPILDMILAIVRRISRRKNVFKGDATHIHHYCIKLG